MSDVSVYLRGEKEGGTLKQKSTFESFSCGVNLCFGVLNICKVKKVPLVVKDKEHVYETQFGGSFPFLSTISRH